MSLNIKLREKKGFLDTFEILYPDKNFAIMKQNI